MSHSRITNTFKRGDVARIGRAVAHHRRKDKRESAGSLALIVWAIFIVMSCLGTYLAR